MTLTTRGAGGGEGREGDPLGQLKDHMARGETTEALRIAAKFKRLGAHKERITRAWSAYANPETYAGMGYDPEALTADGIAAIRERFDIKDNPS